MADQQAGQTSSKVIRTPDQRLRVFVSSTLRELAPEREAVKQAVNALRLYPVMFELGARPHAPRNLYRAYLAQSHIFIGIYWQRYGWVAPDMAISGLEDEYRLIGDLPKLIYIKAPAPEREPRLDQLLQDIKRDSDVSYKYFADPEELGELVRDDLALLLTERFELARLKRDAPPGTGAITAPIRKPIPQPVAPVFGRQSEVQAVRTMLQQERVRLLTLLGPGGVGKTSLALQVAARVADDFADGICWVPLAPISSPDLVTSAIAKALDVRERGGHSLQESLVHYLRQRQLLLLLDNFEHLLAAGPFLMELLAAAPDVKILVTSRAGLELRGEYEFPVPPLPLPAPAEVAPRPAQLMKNAAVRLFVERAQAAKPDFELTLDNSVAVQEIVRRLEGLPLAIELAAARVKLLPPDAILARLSSRLRLLTGGARDLPARQQTMRSTLDWSYQLLKEPTRILLARLGIFAGSFTLSAAEAVADTTGELDVFEGIAALVSNSLLRQSLDDAPSQWSEPRFSMLETVREYALERLAAAGEVELLQERHSAYFARLAADAEPQYFSGQSEAWLDRMAADYSNFRAALLWLQSRPETHRASWHLIRDLLWLWYQRGYLNEARQWYEKALAQSARLSEDPLRGYILVWSGMVAMWQSDLATAAKLMDQGLPIQRAYGDAADLAVSLFGRGVLAVNQGDRATAQSVLEESLRLYRDLDQQWFQAMILLHLGNVALDEGDVEGALAHQQDALARGKQVGDKWVIASGINNLGEIARYQGEHGAAEEHYLESRALFQEVNSSPDVARADHSLGFVALARGDTDRAGSLFQQSMIQHERLGVKRGVVEGVNGLAALLSVQGQPALAARIFTAAQAHLARLGAGIWPADRLEIARYQAVGRAELGEHAFAAACAAGRELAWTEALALVRAATAE